MTIRVFGLDLGTSARLEDYSQDVALPRRVIRADNVVADHRVTLNESGKLRNARVKINRSGVDFHNACVNCDFSRGVDGNATRVKAH